MPDDCLFCRIVKHEIPAKIVFEDTDFVAFRDIAPQAPVHLLVVPKQHIATLDATKDAGLVGRLTLLGAELARREGIADAGYRTVINTNAGAGQTVFHLHLHLLGGRPMKWPPG